MKDKYISNFRHWERLERKYSIRIKRLNVVIEELKQRITDRFYRALDQDEERCDDDQPVAEKPKEFWGNIWGQYADHKKDAKW